MPPLAFVDIFFLGMLQIMGSKIKKGLRVPLERGAK